MQCKKCGATVNDEAAFCPNCGAYIEPIECSKVERSTTEDQPGAVLEETTTEDQTGATGEMNFEGAEAESGSFFSTLRGMDFGIIAVIISIVATIMGLSMFESNSPLLAVALILSFVAYILGGGIGIAFRTAIGFGKAGFVFAPFPFSLLVGVATAILSFYLFLFCPAFFVIKNQISKHA